MLTLSKNYAVEASTAPKSNEEGRMKNVKWNTLPFSAKYKYTTSEKLKIKSEVKIGSFGHENGFTY
jgi:hypothetical protein